LTGFQPAERQFPATRQSTSWWERSVMRCGSWNTLADLVVQHGKYARETPWPLFSARARHQVVYGITTAVIDELYIVVMSRLGTL
jgi:hypothetical protein